MMLTKINEIVRLLFFSCVLMIKISEKGTGLPPDTPYSSSGVIAP